MIGASVALVIAGVVAVVQLVPSDGGAAQAVAGEPDDSGQLTLVQFPRSDDTRGCGHENVSWCIFWRVAGVSENATIHASRLVVVDDTKDAVGVARCQGPSEETLRPGETVECFGVQDVPDSGDALAMSDGQSIVARAVIS